MRTLFEKIRLLLHLLINRVFKYSIDLAKSYNFNYAKILHIISSTNWKEDV